MKTGCLILVSSYLCVGSLFGDTISRLAFGSCARQDLEQPIWQAVLASEPDVWIWMGDNIYASSFGGDAQKFVAAYEAQKSRPGYQALASRAQIIGTWDDHDYGVNDGGKEFPAKVATQKALLDFLEEPENSARRTQQGVYWSYNYGAGDQAVQVILLDTRYFRDDPKEEGGSVLGEQQWRWLESTLVESSAALHFIVSSIQVIPEDHKYEKWANFQSERVRLLDLAARAKGRVLFLSGDRHISEFSRVKHGPDETDLVELSSSSLSHSWKNFPGEPNRHRVGEVYSENNFGLAIIDWKSREIDLQIRSEQGQVAQSMRLSF